MNLSVGIALAAPHIVVDNVRTGYHIHHFQATVDAARYPRADDAVGLETAYQFHGTGCRIHLPDAALGQDDGVVLDFTFCIRIDTFGMFFLFFQELSHLSVLLTHGGDDSYFHKKVLFRMQMYVNYWSLHYLCGQFIKE